MNRRQFFGVSIGLLASSGWIKPSSIFGKSANSRILYPRPLRMGDTIGITAPSAGTGPGLEPRLQFCLETLRKLGYRVRLGKCLRSDKIVSAPARVRAQELQSMLTDDSIDAVMPPWGGELLVDILPLLDFDLLARARPKWIIGYSDLSTFMLPYTLQTHIATLHGTNLLEAPIRPTDVNLSYWNDVVRLPAGASFIQHAASLFQNEDVDWRKNPHATSFHRTKPVVWKCLKHENDPDFHLTISGRLIGGTLDVVGMLPGSIYGKVKEFARSCAPEGLLVYLDNCDFNTAQYCRMLHHLRMAGWFDLAKGILIGRTAGEQLREFTVRNALMDALGSLSMPVLYDMDIGHLPPQLMLINGAPATVKFGPDERSLRQFLV